MLRRNRITLLRAEIRNGGRLICSCSAFSIGNVLLCDCLFRTKVKAGLQGRSSLSSPVYVAISNIKIVLKQFRILHRKDPYVMKTFEFWQ